MRLIDQKLRIWAGRYVLQCGLAFLTMLLVLIFLDVLSHTAIIATLGATAFIVFAMPTSYPAAPRRLIGGYLVGMLVGGLCCALSTASVLRPLFVDQKVAGIVLGALAVGLAIFLMVASNTEHPPAAGLALGLVLNDWDYLTLLFVLGAVILMAVVRRLLQHWMIDLV